MGKINMSRSEADKLIDWARIAECKSSLMMIGYSLLEDEHYDKATAVADLKQEIERLDAIENVHRGMEETLEVIDVFRKEHKEYRELKESKRWTVDLGEFVDRLILDSKGDVQGLRELREEISAGRFLAEENTPHSAGTELGA